MKAAPWAKLWWDWYATRSHAGVGGVALALGPILMLLGRASPRYSNACSNASCDSVWIVTGNGKPVSAAYLSSVSRFSIAEVEHGLSELIEAGTIVVREDGAYGFPNFWRYQESPSAARVRKHRSAPERYSNASGNASGNDKRTEDRGQRKEEGERASAPPPELPPAAVPANDHRATTAPKLQEFSEIFRAAAFDANWSPAPRLTPRQANDAVGRIAEHAGFTGQEFETVARQIAATAFQEARNLGKDVAFVLMSCEPGRPKQARGNGYADATLKPAPASAFDSTSLLKFIEGDGYDHLDAKGDPR